MKKFYLSPMLPDGTPGEVKAICYNETSPEFVEPNNPWIVNAKELSAFRTAVSDAETQLRHAKSRRASSAEVTRLEKVLIRSKRELDTIEYELRRKRQREQIGADSPFARNHTSVETVAAPARRVNAAVRNDTPTVSAYRAQGKIAYETKGMFGTAIMVHNRARSAK
jgi:hypothetical protein